MTKFLNKPTAFIANRLIRTSAEKDAPTICSGISESNGFIIPASGLDLGTASTRNGAGAVSGATSICEFMSTATGNALTLANGIEGQLLTIVYKTETVSADTGILTPTNRAGFSTITFNAPGDTVTLLFTSGNWYIIGTRGVTVA